MIRSRPSTDTYRENWDRIFGKRKLKMVSITMAELRRSADVMRLDMLHEAITGRRMTVDETLRVAYPESYDSHPAAD